MTLKYLAVFVVLVIISVTNGFTVGRHGRLNSVGEQIRAALETKSEVKAWQGRVSSIMDKMSFEDILQLLGDYKKYMALVNQLAEAAGNEIIANSSEEKVLAAFDETLKKAQSEPFYVRIEHTLGKTTVEELLNLLKNTVSEFILLSKVDDVVLV